MYTLLDPSHGGEGRCRGWAGGEITLLPQRSALSDGQTVAGTLAEAMEQQSKEEEEEGEEEEEEGLDH